MKSKEHVWSDSQVINSYGHKWSMEAGPLVEDKIYKVYQEDMELQDDFYTVFLQQQLPFLHSNMIVSYVYIYN